jgi:hypothetical protein
LASITGIPAFALQAGLLIAQLLTSGCSIVLTLHVVNFGHLDRLVLCVYDQSPLDQFSELIEGADPNGEK